LEKIPILVKKINEYLAAINELKKITTFSNDYAFQQSIELNAAMKLPSCYSLNKESSRCIELSQQIIECRKTILFDIEVLKKELQTFVDEN
jgi:hypothetical protein